MKLIWCNYLSAKGKKYILLLKLGEDAKTITGLSHNDLASADIAIIRRNMAALKTMDANMAVAWLKKNCPATANAMRVLPKANILSMKEYQAKPLGD